MIAVLIIWLAIGMVVAIGFGHIAKEMSDEI
jgi:formate/nitrite transporter FocA (FNT family)